MTTFNVLTNCACCTDEELHITFQAYAKMYHHVTSKHQRKMRLVILGTPSDEIRFRPILEQLKLAEVADFQSVSTLVEQVQKATILLHLGQKDCSSSIQLAIKNGVPVLAHDGIYQRQLVDPSCGMLLPLVSEEHSIQQFSQWMQMLYFDPWARKMLRRGAKRRFLKNRQKEVGMMQVA